MRGASPDLGYCATENIYIHEPFPPAYLAVPYLLQFCRELTQTEFLYLSL
jgi:hypothetical protein